MNYHGRHRAEDMTAETTMLPVFTGELYEQPHPETPGWRHHATRTLLWLGFLAALALMLIVFELTVG